MADHFDVVVLGGGPGGYATALYGAAAGLHIALVVPGGRVVTSESEDEFQDRAKLLELMAQTSGGQFVKIDR